ncbi:MAG: NAD-dependent DNA ligase LigA [Lachnospiraceae bacterium]|jgi:DNA ligase (NAD+)
MDEKQKARMAELTAKLDEAARAYYTESREIMSDREYDALYDELAALEKETGIVMAKSPTAHPGYEVLSSLPKVTHVRPMLSLDKTKEVPVLQAFLGSQTGLLSWKMDGLTVVLTYENGVLTQAVTRGNGIVGELVTANARQFINIPAVIPFKGRLILRGEAVISYADFNRMNEEMGDADARYKNPRNLCAGSVRQLDSWVTAQRNVRLIPFALVSAEERRENGTAVPVDFGNSRERQFQWMSAQGFEVVPYRRVTAETLPDAVRAFADEIRTFPLPSDGLVLLMDDIAYGESLGETAKFPRNAMAFKWRDETAETVLREVEWSPSRTGLLNPVAVFDPVELEGTTVSRASLHNVSIVKSMKFGLGDHITVYKANMIIPQIAENLTQSGTLTIPDACPVCGSRTEIRTTNEEEEVQVLMCPNPDCPAKQIGKFELFVSRGAMNIDGISTATAERLVDAGFVKEPADFYHLDRYRDRIVAMDGFGEKSYENLAASIERSRKVQAGALLYALGIPGVGTATGKILADAFDGDIGAIRKASPDELSAVEGIGPVMAADISRWFADPKNAEMLDHLLAEITVQKPEKREDQPLAGCTFVITGSLRRFENRDALKKWIEERGGKAAGSVSKKTTALITNDTESGSAKNRRAAELKIPVLSEDEFLEKYDR